MRYPLLVVLLISTIAIASGEVLSIPTNINGKGVVGKPSSFSINMTVNPIESHTPIDAVLVIDTSPSMNRWSDVIAGGYNYYVQLTKTTGWGSYIGTFELKRTSDVELVLQTPNDVYNTTVYYKAWLVNNSTGIRVTKWSGSWWKWNTDPAVVRWYNLSPGKYDIYAKVSGGGGKLINTTRIMFVELPPERITVAKNAAKFFVGLLSSYDRVGLVNFSANATILLNLTNDKALANSTIDSINASIWYGFKKGGKFKTFVASGTNISAGLIDAISELDKYGRANAVKVIILLTDGWRNLGDDPVDWAAVARSKGYRVYTIGIGGANMPELEEIASVGGGKCYYAKNGTELIEVYKEIYRDVLTYAYNVTLKLEFNNPNIRFDHAVPSPTSASGNVVTWHWNELKNNTSIAVWVNSTVAGNWTVAVGNLTYYDYYGSHSVQFKVNMNFSGNLIVKAVPDKNSIWEGETVNVTITANYPIANITYSAVPEINALNSKVNVTINGTTAVFSWTPYYNYVDNNTTAKITFNVIGFGLNNSTTVGITVFNAQNVPPLIVTAEVNRTKIWEGETVGINITSNYPIGRITYNATPPITNANSIVALTVNNNTAKIAWTPLLNYTNKNTTATINITVYSPPYGTNSTSVSVQVFDKKAPLIVEVIPGRNSIAEGETVTIKVIANYPIDSSNVTISGSPVEINSTNSNIAKYNLNNTTVIVSWTPLQNFVSGGQSYVDEKLTFDVTSNNGLRNSTSTVITVYNRTVNKPGKVLVSRVRNLYIITYLDKTPPKDVGFKMKVDGKVIDYSNDSFILTYFRKNYTAWVLEIAPQYTFTNNLTQNVIANVTFYDEHGVYLNGTEFTINKTNVTIYPEIVNAVKLNRLTIRWVGSIGYPIPLYVGEIVEVDGKLINATNGNVTVNGLEIYTTTNGNISAIFVPNAAGEYTIEVNAINNTTTTLLLWKDVPVRIKPVTPS